MSTEERPGHLLSDIFRDEEHFTRQVEIHAGISAHVSRHSSESDAIASTQCKDVPLVFADKQAYPYVIAGRVMTSYTNNDNGLIRYPAAFKLTPCGSSEPLPNRLSQAVMSPDAMKGIAIVVTSGIPVSGNRRKSLEQVVQAVLYAAWSRDDYVPDMVLELRESSASLFQANACKTPDGRRIVHSPWLCYLMEHGAKLLYSHVGAIEAVDYETVTELPCEKGIPTRLMSPDFNGDDFAVGPLGVPRYTGPVRDEIAEEVVKTRICHKLSMNKVSSSALGIENLAVRGMFRKPAIPMGYHLSLAERYHAITLGQRSVEELKWLYEYGSGKRGKEIGITCSNALSMVDTGGCAEAVEAERLAVELANIVTSWIGIVKPYERAAMHGELDLQSEFGIDAKKIVEEASSPKDAISQTIMQLGDAIGISASLNALQRGVPSEDVFAFIRQNALDLPRR